MKKLYIAPCLIDNLGMETEQLLAGSPEGVIKYDEAEITDPNDFGSRKENLWDDDIDE